MVEKIRKFFEEARQEFRHVNWPSRNEAIRLTSIVIALSIGIALFLGASDYFFSYLLQTFVIRI